MKFEAGKTYATRSICDSNSVFKITVVRRTAKTIWTECGKTLRVFLYEGIEQVKPLGSYSMCPVIGADDVRELPKAEGVQPREEFRKLVEEGRKLFSQEEFAAIGEVVANVGMPQAAKQFAPIPSNVIHVDFRRGL
jgi:hypothetical protein